jgi:hypothetical protein
MFIDRSAEGILAAPAERNVFLTSTHRKNISLRRSRELYLWQTLYKIPSYGIGVRSIRFKQSIYPAFVSEL